MVGGPLTRRRTAATTVIAVVAAYALAAGVALAAAEGQDTWGSGGSGGRGTGVVVLETPPGLGHDATRQQLLRAVTSTGDQVARMTPDDSPGAGVGDSLVHPLTGGAGQPLGPWVRWTVADHDSWLDLDPRGFYVTDADDPSPLLAALDSAGFAAADATVGPLDELRALVTVPSVAGLLVTVMLVALGAAGVEAERGRRRRLVCALVGWTRRRALIAELREAASPLAGAALGSALLVLALWWSVGGLRRPEFVLPVIALIWGGTTAWLLLCRATAAHGPRPSRLLSASTGAGSRRRALVVPIALHVALVAVVAAEVALGQRAADTADRVATSSAAQLDLHEGSVLSVGLAGADDRELDRALARVARDEIAAGRATMNDPDTVPGALVTARGGTGTGEPHGDGDDVVVVRTAGDPEAARALAADVVAYLRMVWTTTDDVLPPLGARLETLPPGVVVPDPATLRLSPVDGPPTVIVEVPLVHLPDDVLATAAFNGRVVFDDRTSVEAALDDVGVLPLVHGWETVGDGYARAAREVLAEQRLVVLAAGLGGLALAAGLVVATTAHVTRTRRRRLLLATVGRSDWSVDLPHVVVGAGLTTVACALGLTVARADGPADALVVTGAAVGLHVALAGAALLAARRRRPARPSPTAAALPSEETP